MPVPDPDVRWKQRFSSYEKALSQLKNAVALGQRRELSDLEKQGLIKAFEFTYELAWNVMRDFLLAQGIANIVGARDAFKGAFRAEVIADGEGWMEMIPSRNLSSHTYDSKVANRLVEIIVERYTPLFLQFEKVMARTRDSDAD